MDKLDNAIEESATANNADSKYNFDAELENIKSQKIAQENLKYKDFNATTTSEHETYEQNEINKEVIEGIGIIVISAFAVYFLFIIGNKLLTYLQIQPYQLRLICFISTLWMLLVPALAVFINEFNRHGLNEPHVVILLTIGFPIYISIAYFLAKKLKFIKSDKL
jgi:hypothetical protein